MRGRHGRGGAARARARHAGTCSLGWGVAQTGIWPAAGVESRWNLDFYLIDKLIEAGFGVFDCSVSGDGQRDRYLHASKSTDSRVAFLKLVRGTVLSTFFALCILSQQFVKGAVIPTLQMKLLGFRERLSNLLKTNFYVAKS